ncbi:Uncharacterised protein [Bordetella pertussis]|nr:Uncharacterised protein [Bordetella pertussis]
MSISADMGNIVEWDAAASARLANLRNIAAIMTRHDIDPGLPGPLRIRPA